MPMKPLVHTEELCSRRVPLEHTPGAKPLVCIGLYIKSKGSSTVIGRNLSPLPVKASSKDVYCHYSSSFTLSNVCQLT